MTATNTTGNQVQEFLDALPQAAKTTRAKPPGSPQAVWKGAMQLNEDLERRLVLHCLTRKGQLEDELGRNQVAAQQWWSQTAGAGRTADTIEEGVFRSFLGRRGLWDLVYRGEMAWRATMYGGLFACSNNHFPVCRRLTQQSIARTQNFFFGTTPWFAISTIGADDAEAAKVVKKWCELGFDRAHAVDIFNQAIELAFIRGECVIKPRWEDRRSYYQDWLTVAIDENNQPIVAEDGDYIEEDDTWHEVTAQGGAEDGTTWVLDRDGVTTLPEYAVEPDDLVFDQMLLDRQEIEYQGLELGILPAPDFLCPLNAESIDRADIAIHIQSRPVVEMCSKWLEHMDKNGDAATMPEVMQFLSDAAKRRVPQSHEFAKRAELGESAGDGARSGGDYRDWVPYDGALVNVAECWVTYDVLNDGVLRKVYVLIDIDQGKAIAYDWQNRVVPPGCGRPFHVVRVNPVAGRWHGTSVMELYYPLNHVVDVAANRINHANQGTGSFRSIELAGLEGFDGVKAPQQFNVTPGALYVRKKGHKHEEVFGETPLINYNQEKLFSMMEFTLQMANNLSGVSSANDNESAGLDSTKLATGIMHLERMNQELFAPLLQHATPGIESACYESVMHMLLHSSDNTDALLYFDSNQEQVALLQSINPKTFRFNLKVLLSRFKAYQQSIQNAAARDEVEHYGSLDPRIRPAIRPFTQKALEIYECDNPDFSLDIIDATGMQILPMTPGPTSAGERATQSNPTQAPVGS